MAQTTTTEIEKKTAPVPLTPKKALLNDECVQEQVSGLAFTEYLITLPQGWILDDLKDPGFWRPIQGGRRPLRSLDRLTIVDFELSWLLEARVSAATETGASLAILKKVSLPARTQNLPQIEDYRLVYAGRGYQVQSKRTHSPVGMIYMSLAEATAALYRMAPKAII
jgi:hypothetical protein